MHPNERSALLYQAPAARSAAVSPWSLQQSFTWWSRSQRLCFGTSDTRRADDDKPVNVDARRLAVLLPPSLDLPDEIIFVIIKFCFS